MKATGTLRILVLDNHDSFTQNLVETLRVEGAAVGVVQSDAISLERLLSARVDGLVLSPGPGRPENAGICIQAIKALDGCVPILGVCLGHQCLGLAYGAAIERSAQVMHGHQARIHHDGLGLFDSSPNPLQAIRYNSLAVRAQSWVGDELLVTAWDDHDEIMGLRRPHGWTESVQFHPESVLSAQAGPIFRAFVARCREFATEAQLLEIR